MTAWYVSRLKNKEDIGDAVLDNALVYITNNH